jgi:predicted DNA-binding ribbon-helix-helix protein
VREVAAQRNMYVTELIGEIKANRRYGNLSSAIRSDDRIFHICVLLRLSLHSA